MDTRRGTKKIDFEKLILFGRVNILIHNRLTKSNMIKFYYILTSHPLCLKRILYST